MLLYSLWFIIQGSQGMNSRQELLQRLWKSALYWLTSWLTHMLTHSRSGVVLYSTIRLTHPVSQEKLSQSSLQANDEAFSCSSLFSSNCSLCQVDINQRAQALSEISNQMNTCNKMNICNNNSRREFLMSSNIQATTPKLILFCFILQ